jgi:hypothetical protein
MGIDKLVNTDQGTHFINDVIRYLIDYFILR